MRRLLALCLFGLACTAGCNLDLGNTDQNNDGQGDDNTDLPGDAYRQCVLATLQQCDAADLPPNACTGLIAANCNDQCDPNSMDPSGQCPPPCDPTTDPNGMCPPPPIDCFETVFNDCVAAGIDPQECAILADQSCNPQCYPGDPNCPPCDPNTMDPSGQCPPPPCTDPNDPTCPPPPPPCMDPTDPNCWPCDPATGMCPPPPPPPCTDPSDPNCYPPPCIDPSDPNCYPPPCNPMDPNCWMSGHTPA